MSVFRAKSRFVQVDGIRTHYFESGEGFPLVLLHSGEFGGCAELSWEFNFEVLARHFRVLAPDWLGYGKTAKLFDFEDMRTRRVDHMTAFLRTLCIEKAHFMGNSMGATTLLEVAAMTEPPWPMDRIVAASGGGTVPDNEARQTLNSYDGSREHMKRVIEALLSNPTIRSDPSYIHRRHRISIAPGSWECIAAARFKRPDLKVGGMTRHIEYVNIKQPTLLVVGGLDTLREPGYAEPLYASIPNVEMHLMKEAGHCPNIDAPDEFNRVVVNFLTRPR